MASDLRDIFGSTGQFESVFVCGIRAVANTRAIGSAILSAANRCQMPALFDPDLTALQMESLRKTCEAHEAQLDKPADDEPENIRVLRGLRALSKTGLPPTKTRIIEDIWLAQLNPVRELRPSRAAAKPILSIFRHEPWDTLKLHFDLERVQTECICESEFDGLPFSLYFNMFPFRSFHAVLVPDRSKHYRQELTKELHRWAWSLVKLVGASVPLFGMGYNSLGAYASVDHLHWQTYIDPVLLPVVDSRWVHNHGSLAYPLCCVKHVTLADSWEWILGRHQADRPYNLIYTPSGVYCFDRRFQGTYTHDDWTSGFAWYECGGGMITFRANDYQSLDSKTILIEYANMRAE